MKVYQTCVLSTLLYGSETWPKNSPLGTPLNTFHQICLCRIMTRSWKDHVSNHEVLSKANIPNMYSILLWKHKRWLAHVSHMSATWMMGGSLKTRVWQISHGHQTTWQTITLLQGHCKNDIKSGNIDPSPWLNIAFDQIAWNKASLYAMKFSEEKRLKKMGEESRPSAQLQIDNALKCDKCSKQ